jgi:RNA polymerase sigma-70 factor (ECF subfamily)
MRDDVGTHAALYFEHGPAVHEVARRICGPRLAEEVTQDVFLHLWRHGELYDPQRGTMRTFLLTMARSRAIDVRRTESARRVREDRTGEVPSDVTPSVEDVIVENETAARVWAALGLLPVREREAIAVAYYGHHSYQETAAILGQPEGTTKARIRSGLRRLRTILTSKPVPGDSPLYATLVTRPAGRPPPRGEQRGGPGSPMASSQVRDG